MVDESIAAGQSETKIRHILAEAIYRQKPLFWVTVSTIVTLTVLAILFMPRRYEADAKIMVQNLRSQPNLSTTTNVSKVVTSDDVTETQMNSEVDLLQSQAVMRRALNLPATSANENHAQMVADQTAIKQMQSHLTVELVRTSSIINLKYTDNNPTTATHKLSSIITAYFNERADLTRATGAADFFARQTKDFGNKLDESRAELTKFEDQHSLVNLDDQKKLQVQRIASLDDSINSTRAHLAEANGRSRTLLHQLAAQTPRIDTVRRQMTNQYATEHLGADLVDLKNQRTQLADRYQPSDRALQELDRKITITQSAIQEATEHPATETASDLNPLWNQVQSLLISANAEISGTVAQQAELLQQRKQAEGRLHELLDSTGTYDTLMRQFQEVQSDYNIYVQKRDEARVGEALDREKMFDVSVVQPPDSSLDPVRPKPVPYFAAGLLLAIFLGAALALFADSSAERIYSPQQLDSATQMRTLSSISKVPAGAASSRSRDLPPESLLEYRRLLYTLRASLVKDINDAAVAEDGAVIQELASHIFAFTSSLIGEGVSYVVRNLAAETARQTNTNVALLDIKRLLQQVQSGGPVKIWTALNPDSSCWEFTFGAEAPQGFPHKFFGELDGQDAWTEFAGLLKTARDEFAYIFLDCPSFRESTVAIELAEAVDGFVLIASAGMVRKRQLEQSAALLGNTRTPLLGYVLNRRTYPVPAWLYKLLW